MIKISHERGVQIIELSRPNKKNAFCRGDVSPAARFVGRQTSLV